MALPILCRAYLFCVRRDLEIGAWGLLSGSSRSFRRRSPCPLAGILYLVGFLERHAAERWRSPVLRPLVIGNHSGVDCCETLHIIRANHVAACVLGTHRICRWREPGLTIPEGDHQIVRAVFFDK